MLFSASEGETLIMPKSSKTPQMKAKICSVGEEAVGKTSLIRRFVADTFDGDYIRTIGTLISKKTIGVEDPTGRMVEVDAVLWDIMGRQGFMDLLKDAYFYKAHGVLAVFDITREETMEGLHGWLQGVYNAAGELPVVVLGNKWDLRGEDSMKEEEAVELSKAYGAHLYLTSAKTGDNVFRAFESLVRNILHVRRHELTEEPADEDDLATRLARP